MRREKKVEVDIPDILADLLNVSRAGLGAGDQVVGAVLLVGGDEVGIVDAGKRDHLGHLLADEVLEGRLQHLGTVHGVSQVQAADVPAANDKVVGVDHGQDVVEGDVDVQVGLGIVAELQGRAHDDGAVVVGGLGAVAGVPDQVAAVGHDAGSHGGAVVAAPADQHDAELGDLGLDLEVVDGLAGGGHADAVLALRHRGGAVGVLGADLGVRVHHIGRVDDELGAGRNASRGGSAVVVVSITVRGARIGLSVRCHVCKGGFKLSIQPSGKEHFIGSGLGPLHLQARQSNGLLRTGDGR